MATFAGDENDYKNDGMYICHDSLYYVGCTAGK